MTNIDPRPRPSPAELRALRARIEGNEFAAAASLGLSRWTIRHQLRSLYEKVGAVSAAHAVYLCWPYLRSDFPALKDRRTGYRRRRS